MTLSSLLLSMLSISNARSLTSGTPRLTITQQPLPLASSPASLTCSAASDSLPDIAWYRDGILIPGKATSNVTIGNVLTTFLKELTT